MDPSLVFRRQRTAYFMERKSLRSSRLLRKSEEPRPDFRQESQKIGQQA